MFMRKAFLGLASLALIASACTREPVVNEVEEPVSAEQDQQSCFVPGQMIVQLSEELTALVESGEIDGVKTRATSFSSALADAGVVSMERLYPDAGEWEERHRAAGLHRWYRLGLDESAAPATKASIDIASIEGVVFAEPQRVIKSTAVFNDPHFSDQWGYFNDGSLGSKYRAGADINVVPVWENYTGGTPNVIVAVIDSGVDAEHPDLKGAVIPGGPNGSKCFVYDYTGYGLYPDDHGTHVSGTIAAINNNGVGVCGVAGGLDGNGGVRIMSCQIMHTDPKTGDNLQGDDYNAIVWAADHGAVIAQNSWGYDYKTAQDAERGSVGAVGPAIDYFNRYAGCDKNGNQLPDSPMKGGVVFFASGNDGWQHAWPAEYDGVIAVGAINSMLAGAYYSNYGPWVDICAPGGDYQMGPTILSTVPGGGYDSFQGTSMACPHVSGVAALIVSYFGGPGFTNEMLKDRLIGGANYTKIPSANKLGPLVDAYGSFTFGSKIAPDKVESLEVSAKSNAITSTWKVTADEDDIKAFAYVAMYTEDKSLLESYTPGASLPKSVYTVVAETGSASVGDEISATVKRLNFNTQYYCAVVAYDYNSNYSEISPIVAVNTLGNNPPVISCDHPEGFRIKAFESASTVIAVMEPDDHNFEISTESGSDAAVFTKTTAGDHLLSIIGKNAPEGKYIAKFTATDEYGAVAELLIPYEILHNNPPQSKKQFENIILNGVGQSAEFNLNDYFTDIDGETLAFTGTSASEKIAHPYVEMSKMIITSLDFGQTEITVTASDAVGELCEITFKVLVRDGKQPIDVYPNPVSDYLFVRTGENASANIKLVDMQGAAVYDKTMDVTPFDPAKIDVREMAAGAYSVIVDYSGKKITKNIVIL